MNKHTSAAVAMIIAYSDIGFFLKSIYLNYLFKISNSGSQSYLLFPQLTLGGNSTAVPKMCPKIYINIYNIYKFIYLSYIFI